MMMMIMIMMIMINISVEDVCILCGDHKSITPSPFSDVKEDHADPGDVPDFLFPVAISKITQCSTFVVVCRLRLHQHTITSQESELVWPEFPLARISFPQNAVRQDESFEVIVEVSLSHLSITYPRSSEICYSSQIKS